MRFATSILLLPLFIAATATASSLKDTKKLERCSVTASPSSCPKDQYCLAAKPHSYCTAKLKGGAECEHDSGCQSDVCFVSKGKKGKRVCASLPLRDYPLGSRCTESKQCKGDLFCGEGYCSAYVCRAKVATICLTYCRSIAKPVGAGEKCSKDAACSEKESVCLDKPAAFVVYDKFGKAQTRKLSAGKCSYVTNLGKGMKCHSDRNCYSDFECSKTTKKCSSETPPAKLPYEAPCSSDSACASNSCVDEQCACSPSDCTADRYCSSSAGVCFGKGSYSDSCRSSDACLSGICKNIPFYGGDVCGCVNDSSCSFVAYCQTDDLTASDSNTCVVQLPYGLSCSRDRMCKGVCLEDSATCSCAYDNDCGSGFTCNQSTYQCVAIPPPTDLPYQHMCQHNDECISGACLSGACGCQQGGTDCEADASTFCDASSTCSPKGGYGADCRNPGGPSEDCISSACKTTGTCGCTSETEEADCGPHTCRTSDNVCVA